MSGTPTCASGAVHWVGGVVVANMSRRRRRLVAWQRYLDRCVKPPHGYLGHGVPRAYHRAVAEVYPRDLGAQYAWLHARRPGYRGGV